MSKYTRRKDYTVPHYQVWEKRMGYWRWIASTPYHSDLNMIIMHGEKWLQSAPHKIVWVKP